MTGKNNNFFSRLRYRGYTLIIMIYTIKRFSTSEELKQTKINPAEANKFRVDFNRITTSMGTDSKDPLD